MFSTNTRRIILNVGLLLSTLTLFSAHPLFAGEGSNGSVSDGIPEGCMLVQGDILVRINDPDPFGCLEDKLWPGGVIPYSFHSDVTEQWWKDAMIEAMAVWEDVANVDFVPWNSHFNFIVIHNSTVNNSFVGMQGGPQVVNIASWGSKFTIVHELGHALGLHHEHCRWDRMEYVEILWENIEEGEEHNFEFNFHPIYPKPIYGLSGEETYDFDSVMHYDQYAFSKNGNPTIMVKAPYQHWQNLIGLKDNISDLDIITMSSMYPEDGWIFLDKHYSGFQLGTFLQPCQTYSQAYAFVPSGGTMKIQPGTHTAVGTWDKELTLDAPLGHVSLGK